MNEEIFEILTQLISTLPNDEQERIFAELCKASASMQVVRELEEKGLAALFEVQD